MNSRSRNEVTSARSAIRRRWRRESPANSGTPARRSTSSFESGRSLRGPPAAARAPPPPGAGAYGTAIQARALADEDYRGTRFRDHPREVKGDPDLLNLTRPDVVEEIHRAYLDAGADIVTTNTFTAPAIAQADYGPL